ncbi:MAG: amidase family protein [Sneathiella sp.]|uniref:amidase family protein n=1 Tax=Sneathiella sp. TaxID=1964365 RepID=UPI0030038175
MDEIWQWGAVKTAAAIRNKDISAKDAVDAALSRMEKMNGRVNAVTVDLSKEARNAANEADAIQATSIATGPLHGVPITIKENVDQVGYSTPNGIPDLDKIIATEDSPVVSNLQKAGAIIIGRTNTPEFSYRWFTDNPLRGKTLNPWNHGVTPGGSSGGASSSVALGIGAMGHGNDLGGSLRYPAYACGVATIRPSMGRVPAYNPTGAEERPPMVQLMSVQGPIAREVRDVRLSLEAMIQHDPRDPWHTAAPLNGSRLETPIKVALTKTPAGIPCHPTVSKAVDEAGRLLAAAGYEVELIDPPLVAEIAEAWRSLLMTDTQVMSETSMRTMGSEDFIRVLDGYLAASNARDLDGQTRAFADRTRLLRAWSVFMEEYPLIVAPVSQTPPFPQDADQQGNDRIREMLDEQSMLYAINLLGLPAAAVPTGIADGIPTGVQIIGRRFREDTCLDAAQVIENTVGVLTHQLWARE